MHLSKWIHAPSGPSPRCLPGWLARVAKYANCVRTYFALSPKHDVIMTILISLMCVITEQIYTRALQHHQHHRQSHSASKTMMICLYKSEQDRKHLAASFALQLIARPHLHRSKSGIHCWYPCYFGRQSEGILCALSI